MADFCSVPPEILAPAANKTLELALGSQIVLNCTVRWAISEHCEPVPIWTKDGQWLGSENRQDSMWFGQNASERLLATVLQVNLTHDADFGVFACWVSNATATFTLQRREVVGHVSAVLAALLVLALLVLLAGLYIRCRLSVLLWYRNHYGELEMNDGKLYDAYVSHATAPDDRKFVHFIVKPQLENRYGYKLYLDEQNILPNAEPSADLIMNVSRCRRLIVVLSVAYLEQDWCNSSFREGLWRLLELSKKPIFIVFESQYREITHPAISLLKHHRSAVTLLVWRAGSMTPSSDFWKELCLALPRKVAFRGTMGDPQTQLQEDKDPMLILHSSYLDSRGDPHPDGDLGTGLRGYAFRRTLPPRISVPGGPTALATGTQEDTQLKDSHRSEIDVSDLGSRNYGARTDFYCLVTEDDI
ncbi:single Ig IL-1-related receptor [Lagopus leucura]|uniref:single Ig IL-1-related receptor n=1 Tax=Lagopus leucura TaxID=30410 RepID=UPI001C677DE0|nr:single Ig IL-1-related receptor [Lagopus leucura]XP_042738695.1 single Ig IL-1-related receptor [Lagopus leucura]XP_042738696.1 single Ig IL-1-related receptor [Lagopus leucura]XP_042738697.1 single Ig IL-1-related receptor [Lagopus leucura]